MWAICFCFWVLNSFCLASSESSIYLRRVWSKAVLPARQCWGLSRLACQHWDRSPERYEDVLSCMLSAQALASRFYKDSEAPQTVPKKPHAVCSGWSCGNAWWAPGRSTCKAKHSQTLQMTAPHVRRQALANPDTVSRAAPPLSKPASERLSFHWTPSRRQ